jgi:hypothetical protein
MVSGIKKVILNGKKTRKSIIKQAVSALHNKTIIAEKGGYLFKVHIQNHHLHIGIVPYYINGQRAHHYDIEITEHKYTLTGFINSNKSISLLVKLTQEEYKKGLSLEDKTRFHETYIRFALFLLEYGYPESTEIDMVTRMLLKELELSKEIPTTIKELGNLA